MQTGRPGAERRGIMSDGPRSLLGRWIEETEVRMVIGPINADEERVVRDVSRASWRRESQPSRGGRRWNDGGRVRREPLVLVRECLGEVGPGCLESRGG